jgi:hypothetical protein
MGVKVQIHKRFVRLLVCLKGKHEKEITITLLPFN